MPFREAEVPNLGQAPTASDIILKFIRDSIADGSLDEGEPIRQDDVARMFNVSKIPVREALKRLEAEGLVEFQRNKGAIVTTVSEPEIAQIFETRAILESNAIMLSVPHMTPETFTDAEAFCDAFARETDVAQWSALNWQFHSRLYLDAQRPFLVSTVRAVNDRLERYLRIQLALSHGQGTADREHREILAACRTGKVKKAGKLVYDHIMGACSSLLHHLPASKGKG
ncbi:transcriptional regulator, GntR family [Paracoccus halophilus]|uniref:GntR family transcriptional regulator n=1 Tax=Paracoccus halophilus TaxID=376733 RepID=A0A099EVF8_9RHOB|nr:GntR family transcriptional regulator [Paracoccus halophilus]KGJ02249.1 GntR family transcriptional regulator [Paracoccus halophilus]SFA61677.1 transcriptional regulator, GntR family [Paracoccus halophilus]